jgi:hypothetical protein
LTLEALRFRFIVPAVEMTARVSVYDLR